MVKWFLVSGWRPAVSKTVNNFLVSSDLGISGAFVEEKQALKITFNADKTQELIDQVEREIKRIYAEYFGWEEVVITVFDGDKMD